VVAVVVRGPVLLAQAVQAAAVLEPLGIRQRLPRERLIPVVAAVVLGPILARLLAQAAPVRLLFV